MKRLSFLQKNRVDLRSISEVRNYVTEWPRFFGPPCTLSYSYEIIIIIIITQLVPKDDQMTKTVTGSKFKMAVAAILNSVRRPYLGHF